MAFQKDVWNTYFDDAQAYQLATAALDKFQYYIGADVKKATIFRANGNYKGFNLFLSLSYIAPGGIAKTNESLRQRYIDLDNIWISKWNALYGVDTWRTFSDADLEQEIYDELGFTGAYIEQLKEDKKAQEASKIAFAEAQKAEEKRKKDAEKQAEIDLQAKKDLEALERSQAAAETAIIRKEIAEKGYDPSDMHLNVFEIIDTHKDEVAALSEQIYETKKEISEATGMSIETVAVSVEKNEIVTTKEVAEKLSAIEFQKKVTGSLFDFNQFMQEEIQSSELYEGNKPASTSLSTFNILVALGILAFVLATTK